MKTRYTIPFFITHAGCPFQCVFCRQDKITGHLDAAMPQDVSPTIKKYLKTIKPESHVEVAFFGGSFTGIDKKLQAAFLKKVKPYLRKGLVDGVRLSTRPDYITSDILHTLKKHKVDRIELGVQSMRDRVLKRSLRGHTFKDIENASKLILKHGFKLGHQIMIGLPGSSLRDELYTAKRSIEMGASEVRLYPVLVIKGTYLANLWKKGAYEELSEREAIKRAAKLMDLFYKNKVRVIRCGLHPSEGLITKKEMLAGPFHVAFRQKAETYRFGLLLDKKLENSKKPVKKILYNPLDASFVLGYKRENALRVEKRLGRKDIFTASDPIERGKIRLV